MSDKINIKPGVTRISLIGLVYGAIVGIISFFIQVYFKGSSTFKRGVGLSW
jgi:hypothetical protein